MKLKIFIILAILVIFVIIYNRWNKFKQDWEDEQRKLLSEGQLNTDVPTNPTLTDFLNGGNINSSTNTNTNNNNNVNNVSKDDLIDQLESKYGITFSTVERIKLKNFSTTDLQLFIDATKQEMENYLSDKFGYNVTLP